MTMIQSWIRATVAALWTRAAAPMASVVFVAMLPALAMAQDAAEPAQGDQIAGIAAAVVGVIAFIGTLVARWTETNPDLPWYVRLSRVFDATQIVDSTRKLGD